MLLHFYQNADFIAKNISLSVTKD